MIDVNDKILLRQIIMEHYTEPENKKLIENPSSIIQKQDSATCSDEIDVQLLIENNIILDARFDGVACAIAISSSDILCNELKNKSLKDAILHLDNYHKLITGEKYNNEILNELIVFSDIHKQGNRINCALLAADGFKKIILNEVK
ncbi:iron-sulfur cluster assembly scaffold protein [Spiroplasma turonicum]|uniref:FeS assembly protein n=1 Tax=Spiroplasma turonicum TaxID=216946 RepID=A0A0K1P5A1_9MOLU|nr:iron-sulfur cluster assembly scaffold protein [Spiroplasma turonicum]AKU79463.1 FeS assembly protein [Spiroplasma turonicum]ALX70485.1 FeS assembly protein [Spiroplasma turonicum]